MTTPPPRFAICLLACLAGSVCAQDGDECDRCIPIGDGVFEGTLQDNGGQIDDTSCGIQDGRDEWYCYTSPCTGIARAEVCGQWAPILAVFDACEGNEIGCTVNLENFGCGEFDSARTDFEWPVELGQTYYIRVSGIDFRPIEFVLEAAARGQCESPVDCDAIRRLRARCGRKALKAVVKSRLDEGTRLTLADGETVRPVVTDARGKAKAKFPAVPGRHDVAIRECPEHRTGVQCR